MKLDKLKTIVPEINLTIFSSKVWYEADLVHKGVLVEPCSPPMPSLYVMGRMRDYGVRRAQRYTSQARVIWEWKRD